jgi:GNAT superfamily N-acetyltransferase
MAGYHIYAQGNAPALAPSAMHGKTVPAGAQYFGYAYHPQQRNAKPTFAVSSEVNHGHGNHRLYLTEGDHNTVVCYVTVDINRFSSLSGVPAAIVAAALDVEPGEVPKQDPVVAKITHTVTMKAWERQWIASDLLPALVHFATAHGAVALVSDNTSCSGRYNKYFGGFAVKETSYTGTWIGINLQNL